MAKPKPAQPVCAPVLPGLFDRVVQRLPSAMGAEEPARYNGPAYDPRHDQARLTGQMRRIWDLMADRAWRSLDEIAQATGEPPASISAQLRHFRKERFGSHTVERRQRGDRAAGLWEYRLLPRDAL